jgi:competence protein CoiA
VDDSASTDAEKTAKYVLREAHDVGCFGLIHGEAIRIKTGVRILAHVAQSTDGPFCCPRCWTKAIVHKDRGGGRIDHFAHIAPLTPLIPHGETEFHRAAKNEICDALKDLMPTGKWEVERRIPKNAKRETPDLVPDISGYLGEQRLAIEVQWSTLSLATILKRSKAYYRWRTPVLWILPLKEMLNGEFRPRSFERYLHSMYFGRVYYWVRGNGLRVIPTHYVPVQRWIDTREWIDAEGEQSGGGFQKMLRVVKNAHVLPVIDITADFLAQERNEFRPWNEKRIVPRLWLWRDKLKPWWDEEREDAIRKAWDKEAFEWGEEDSVPPPPPSRETPSEWIKAKRYCAACDEMKVAMHKEIPSTSGRWICSSCFARGYR